MIFEFETIERGASALFISDLLGNVVQNVFSSSEPGHFTVEASTDALAAGVYFYTLQTPTARLSKALMVAR